MLTRLLCLLLRHDPASCNLSLEEGGWASLPSLVESIRGSCSTLSTLQEEDIRALVETQTVDRFEIVGGRIRCKYGHSLPDIMTAVPGTPPPILYHATRASFFSRISHKGLRPQGRSFVHLTSDWDYALTIREMRTHHTTPGIIFGVDTAKALSCGCDFLSASEEVWLAASLPPRVLTLVTVHRKTRRPLQYLPLTTASHPPSIEDVLPRD